MDSEMERLRRQQAELLELCEETRTLVIAHEAKFGPLQRNPATDSVIAELQANLARLRRQEP